MAVTCAACGEVVKPDVPHLTTACHTRHLACIEGWISPPCPCQQEPESESEGGAFTLDKSGQRDELTDYLMKVTKAQPRTVIPLVARTYFNVDPRYKLIDRIVAGNDSVSVKEELMETKLSFDDLIQNGVTMEMLLAMSLTEQDAIILGYSLSHVIDDGLKWPGINGNVLLVARSVVGTVPTRDRKLNF